MLYQVLPEKSSAVGGAMMGSSHVYDMAAVSEHCTCVCFVLLPGLDVGSAWNDIEKGEYMQITELECVHE